MDPRLIALIFCANLALADFAPKRFAYMLQAGHFAKTREQAVQKLSQCDRDLLIIDYSFWGDHKSRWTPQEVAAIRDGKPGRKVLAYLSIGEAGTYRHYWQKDAPYLLSPNPNWPDNIRVEYWRADWQAILQDYLAEIIRQGFDGIWLDTVDSFEYFEHDPKTDEWRDNLPNPKTGQTYRDDMAALVRRLAEFARQKRPGFLVVPNNGAQLLNRPDYLKTIDAIGIEDLYANRKYRLDQLAPAYAAKLPILTIEYKDKPAIRTLRPPLLITDRPLKTLGEAIEFVDIVEDKIAGLGLRNDLLEYHERPREWLSARIEEVQPRLIAHLDSQEERIASGCLKLLAKLDRNEPMPEMLRIALARDHKAHASAMRALCRFGSHAETHVLLNEAKLDEARFPNPEIRAEFAAAIGDFELAVVLIASVLGDERSYKFQERIERLGHMRHRSAVDLLKSLADEPHWRTARLALIALAVNSDEHALSETQRRFLDSTAGFKVSYEQGMINWQEIATSNQDELRELALRNIRSDYPSPGLTLLAKWQDRAALPVLESLLPNARRALQTDILATMMIIDGSNNSIDRAFSEGEAGRVVRHLCLSHLSESRKAAVLGHARHGVLRDKPEELIGGFPYPLNAESVDLLNQLIENETDLAAIAAYARRTAKLPQRRTDLILEALRQAGPATVDAGLAIRILAHCVGISGAAEVAASFMDSERAALRIAAARVACSDDASRSAALSLLINELPAQKAREALMQIPCRDNAERRQREHAVLRHIDRPTEDSILRLLSTCCGNDTIDALTPWLDAADFQRGIHAAWILRNAEEEPVAGRAQRRLAIFSMFRQSMGQGGYANDPSPPCHTMFRVAGDLYHRANEWLKPLILTSEEQDFSIRCYQHSRFVQFPSCPIPSSSLNVSFIPLLQTIVKDDAFIGMRILEGQPVAEYSRRRKAAEEIAKLTGKPIDYFGPVEDLLDTENPRLTPYADQFHLIARVLRQRSAAGDSSAEASIQKLMSSEHGKKFRAAMKLQGWTE
ncbi:MAG: hypothetical protein ACI8W8_000536 [Rhodothermales bacterium]|jgi:uncharacterized protein (TIGR01370 family)